MLVVKIINVLQDPVPLLSVYKEELLEKIRLAQEKKEETSEQIQVFEMKDKKQKIGSFWKQKSIKFLKYLLDMFFNRVTLGT